MTNQTMSVELRDKVDALVCAAMGAGFVCLNIAGRDHESETYYMRRVEVSRGGFSVGKALVASALVGTSGLVAGAGGRRRETWACRECGFVHTYGM